MIHSINLNLMRQKVVAAVFLQLSYSRLFMRQFYYFQLINVLFLLPRRIQQFVLNEFIAIQREVSHGMSEVNVYTHTPFRHSFLERTAFCRFSTKSRTLTVLAAAGYSLWRPQSDWSRRTCRNRRIDLALINQITS